ncbi:MAG: ASKHA domain-containing protein [Peptococcaceae bacterium]|nr:ASKHA domain-containing protein [Peptococcaceae bacterium]
MSLTVTFFPSGKKAEVAKGALLLDAAAKAEVRIQSLCGFAKSCGKCKVLVLDRKTQTEIENPSPARILTRLTSEEMKLLTAQERSEGMRLACCAKVLGDVDIFVPSESRVETPLILDKVRGREIILKPAVLPYYLELTPPTLEDHRDDFTRIKDALAQTAPQLKNIRMDYRASRELSAVLRKAKWKVTLLILYDNEIIGVRPGQIRELYGVAMDIGTTTVAAYLCNLNTGKLVESASGLNRQVSFGADVLSRVSYCMNQEEGLTTLHQALCDTVNSLIGELAAQAAVNTCDIVEMTLVFNTVMQHIALNIPPDTIGVAPFISSFQESVDIKARDLNFDVMPGANVHCLPSIAGFIGSDCTAVLISEEPYQQEKNLLIIDIGTNSEICLGGKQGLYSTSCATGPALEGAQISCGMRAENGAIQHILIDPVTLEPELDVIGGEIPRGICGSGIIDAIAQLAKTGVILPDGKFSKDVRSSRVRLGADGKKYEYVIYFAGNTRERDIAVTQKDVRAVQLAKAALYSGAKTLMKTSGIDKIDGVVLAGAFGNYIDKENAVALGMFPDCGLDKVRVAGNAAGEGARLALVNTDKRTEAYRVAKSVVFVESAVDEGFYKQFGEAIAIPHERDLFLANQPGSFACSGIDQRTIPPEIRLLGEKAYTDAATMLWSIRQMAALEKQDFIRLPLTQTVEAQAYGAKMSWKDGVPVPDGYLYHRISQLRALSGEALSARAVRAVIECVLAATGEKIILDISGPFSILCGLLEPTMLMRGVVKEAAAVKEALAVVVDFLALYVAEAIAGGVQVISFADTVGVMELVGEGMYKNFCGPAVMDLLKRLEPELDRGLIHFCGKTSVSLQKCGFIRMKPRRIPPEVDYRDTLFALAEDKSIRFVGNQCLNSTGTGQAILWQAELR